MEYVRLINGLEMPMVGLGTYPLTGKVLNETLKMASGAGYQLIDTAGAYNNESDIGLCIQSGVLNRDELFLTSKVNWFQLRGRLRYLFLNKETVKGCSIN